MYFEDSLYEQRPVTEEPGVVEALAALGLKGNKLLTTEALSESSPSFRPDPRMVAAYVARREPLDKMVHRLLYGPLPPSQP